MTTNTINLVFEKYFFIHLKKKSHLLNKLCDTSNGNQHHELTVLLYIYFFSLDSLEELSDTSKQNKKTHTNLQTFIIIIFYQIRGRSCPVLQMTTNTMNLQNITEYLQNINQSTTLICWICEPFLLYSEKQTKNNNPKTKQKKWKRNWFRNKGVQNINWSTTTLICWNVNHFYFILKKIYLKKWEKNWFRNKGVRGG